MVRWCLCAFVLVGCQHEQLRVDGDEVKGPGYRLKIPEGFTAQEADKKITKNLLGRLVLLVGEKAESEAWAPAISHTDVSPKNHPTDDSCRFHADETRKERAETLSQEVELTGVKVVEDENLGPVCHFHLHYKGDGRHGAFRIFKVILDGSTVTCSTPDANAAETLCDNYLASFRAPRRFFD